MGALYDLSPGCASDCCQDEDCPCGKVCDEGDYCEKHGQEVARYWSDYFGLTGLTAEQRRAHMASYPSGTREEYLAAWELKRSLK